MTAPELLARQTLRAQERFLQAFHRIPADQREWSDEGRIRSALDQFQEVATMLDLDWGMWERGSMPFDRDLFTRWSTERKLIKDVAALESQLRAATERLVGIVRDTPADRLAQPFALPFPGEYTLADVIHNHAWNLTYHEGQINMLAMRLGVDF